MCLLIVFICSCNRNIKKISIPGKEGKIEAILDGELATICQTNGVSVEIRFSGDVNFVTICNKEHIIMSLVFKQGEINPDEVVRLIIKNGEIKGIAYDAEGNIDHKIP
jgi:hypothetical protein